MFGRGELGLMACPPVHNRIEGERGKRGQKEISLDSLPPRRGLLIRVSMCITVMRT